MKRFLTVISALCITGTLWGASLKCNYSSADISTVEGEHVALAGFAARRQLSDGIHIPLRTHALVISDGAQKVCIISNDMMEINPVLSGQIRMEISDRTGLAAERILIHNIHTHSAPRTGGECSEPGGTNAAYKERAVEAIISNAVKAITDEGAFREFTIEIAKGTTDINTNRCEVGGPVDHDLYAAKFINAKGEPICAFFNLACHPVCMGPGSLLLSSDYSGVARRLIADEWGCEVFQFTGAAGNMDPVGGCRDVLHAEATGAELAESLSSLRFEKVGNGEGLRFSTRAVGLPYRIANVTPEAVIAHADSLSENSRTSFPRFADDVQNWKREILERFENGGGIVNSLEFEMSAVSIDGIIFFFSQGEPFCEYQMEARAAFPDRTVFFAGYTSGQNSYLPSARAYKVRKGYEYEVEQMHVYIKAPYPLSDKMPEAYSEAVFKTIAAVAGEPRYNIIPRPAKITSRTGEFSFEGEPDIKYVEDGSIPPEGYVLDISTEGISVGASTDAGRFYAMQTIKQLLPAEIWLAEGFAQRRWTLPCCLIEDAPKFGWRGMQLDCGRYFYPKEEILKFIDLMAMHKQNVFHWHLTEDQGWRIEIKKYPLLTEVGAFRAETGGYDGDGDGIPHGGYYTQADIREVVEYARERFITVVPELEIPGHSSAAIAAYPNLSCTPDEEKEVSTTWGVKEDVYCPSPATFKFLEDVIDEMLELFPSPYFHIGGDECPPTAWLESGRCRNLADSLGLSSAAELQHYFVRHFEDYLVLVQKGKTVIGWDEILDGGASPNTVVMSYRGHKPASNAFRKGMNVILTPDRWCYYNYQQEEIEDVPNNRNIFLTLRKAYTYNYMDSIDGDVAPLSDSLLLGIQACVWGEYNPTVAKVESDAFPRAAAMAELGWTPDSERNWNSFRVRMGKELERLDAWEVNYSKAYWQVIVNMDLGSEYPRDVELELDYPYADIRYTIDGTEPTASSPTAPRILNFRKGDSLKARGFAPDGTPVGKTMTRTF